MLLNEVQQEQPKIAVQATEPRDLKRQMAELQALKQDLHAALLNLQ
jgi:hypothetical protein